MKKNYLNSNPLTACEMLEVTDKDILDWSNGEVTDSNIFNEDENGSLNISNHALFSKQIFGNPLEETMKMGHISLPVPVVNTQYLRGKKPVLPRILDVDRKALESVIGYGLYYNAVDDTFLSEKEVTENIMDVCFQGGLAVEKMLEKKGISSERYILHNVPVIPAALRIHEAPCKKGIMLGTVNMIYVKILNRKNRLAKLLELNAPAIIVSNEKRMLEDNVSALISNGAFSFTAKATDGEILESLDDIADEIKNVFHKSNVSSTLAEYLANSEIDPQNFYKKMKESVAPYKKDTKAKHDKVMAEIRSDVSEIIETVFYTMFGNYECYKAEFVIAAENNVDYFLSEVQECLDYYMNEDNYEPEDILIHVIELIYRCMENMKKKRVQWISFDNYTLLRGC